MTIKHKRGVVTVKRRAKLTGKQKTQRKVERKVASPQPENPEEALAWLHALAEHARAIRDDPEAFAWIRGLSEHVRDLLHGPPAPFANTWYFKRLFDARYLSWFADAVEIYTSKKNRESLERILGLKTGAGRPMVRERRAEILAKFLKVARLRGEGLPWKVVGKKSGMSPKAARMLYARELSNLDEAWALARAKEARPLAEKIVARLEQKLPRETAKARSAALASKIHAHNRRAP